MASRRNFQYRLIDAELIAGISFCHAAETSQDPVRKTFNMEQAERAYHEALNLARGSKLTRAMKDALEYKTDYLRHLLSEYRKQRVIFKLESVGVCSNKRSAA